MHQALQVQKTMLHCAWTASEVPASLARRSEVLQLNRQWFGFPPSNKACMFLDQRPGNVQALLCLLSSNFCYRLPGLPVLVGVRCLWACVRAYLLTYPLLPSPYPDLEIPVYTGFYWSMLGYK